MATRIGFQGKGIGSNLMGNLEQELARISALNIVLPVRAFAGVFYGKLGFWAIGEAFEGVTLPCPKVEKALV